MYGFEGEFRRRPQQSFAGASKKEKRDEFLQRKCEERQKREESRKKCHAAICIQSFVRGLLTRRKEWRREQAVFTELQQFVGQQQSVDEMILEKIIRGLLFFYQEKEDASKLLWTQQLLLKYKDSIACLMCKSPIWILRIKKLLNISLRYLTHIANTNAPIALPMRTIELFTTSETYNKRCNEQQVILILSDIFTFLIRKGFYTYFYTLVNGKVPKSLEKSVNPPTELSKSLFLLMVQPVELIPYVPDYNYRKIVLRSLCVEFLCKCSTEQISNFIIPQLVSKSPVFPFGMLLEVVLDDGNASVNPCLSVPNSVYLLNVILHLASQHLGKLSEKNLQNYLQVVYCLRQTIHLSEPFQNETSDSEDEDETADARLPAQVESDIRSRLIVDEIVDLMNEPWNVHTLLSILDRGNQLEKTYNLSLLSYICYELLIHQKMSMNEYKLLYTLAFRPKFLKNLWSTIVNANTESVFGSGTPCLQMLARALFMRLDETLKFVPLLSLFCCLFSYLLHTLHDSELYTNTRDTVQSSPMPFTIAEIVVMSLALRDVCLGLVELELPDAPRSNIRQEYRQAVDSSSSSSTSITSTEFIAVQTKMLSHLFKVTVNLVRQLHNRDSRQSFCPKDHWISNKVNIPVEKPLNINVRRGRLRMYRPFIGVRAFTRDMMDEGPPLSVTELRKITILRELSFVVPFENRVMILQQLINKDKMESQGELSNFLAGPQIQVLIRRNYIYEDAFEKLSPDNESNLKLKMRVHLVNAVGLDEAGIDGGGIFREFLSELLKTAFDPNRGFFKITHDNMLYPNSDVHLLVDNFAVHYYFIGRMLGKALYENMLVELPLASFFLTKLLSRHSGKVDIHHLESLDPVVYRNLLYLKYYEGDVSDLGLDFTVANSVLGETRIEELKPDGSNTPVDNVNRIKYIHLMADYKLNRQIRSQCDAFRMGLSDLINVEWLQMFDARELQVLISGASVPVDLQDLKKHTTYSGGYSDEHPVIQVFWKVVENMDDRQRKQLLKFVTSCSRPPLLGFKELYPAFCIQNAGGEDRLPTASTCMNLLKLPEFTDENILRTKLLYAIESCSGFELS